jgi:hypothetical protein
VHADGKNGNEYGEVVERLPCMLIGFEDDVERLLEIPAIPNGKGETIAMGMHNALVRHGLEDRVVAVCQDTTAANSGKHIGSGVLLEKKLGGAVSSPYCRFHIFETVLGAAFKNSVSPIKGPAIADFKHF